jgi:death-on-curing protein
MEAEPLFLTLDEVLEIHAYQIQHFGGTDAILDLAKLESVIAQPRQSFGGQRIHEDLAAMAAAYLFYITQSHPFADGNKRTGTHAALTFLGINGYDLNVPVDEMEQLVLGVATGQVTKDQVASFLRTLMAA